MFQLADLQLFVRVAAVGSMSEVARQMDLTPAAASATVKRLEAALEARLFERSTRSLRLTPAGETFLGYCEQALSLIDEGRARLRSGAQEVAGPLRLGAPSDLGRGVLPPVLDDFQRAHPGVQLTLHLSDSVQDLVREDIDLVLRYGEPRDSSLVARRLRDNDRVVCAAPSYLQAHPPIRKPVDLLRHNCICFFLHGEMHDQWTLTSRKGEAQRLQVAGDRSANDGAMVRQWAVAGRGVVYKSRLDVQADLDAGRLVPVLGGWRGEPTPLYVVYPSRRFQPARLRALVDHLAVYFAR